MSQRRQGRDPVAVTAGPRAGTQQRVRRILGTTMTWLLAAAVAAALVLAATTACAPSLFGGQPVITYDTLAARPRLEEMIARYEQMQQRIRDRIDAELGPQHWEQWREASVAGCDQDVWKLGGRARSLGSWGIDAPIPDRDWPRVHQIVAEVTGEYGFVTAGLAIDTPGHHLTNGVDPDLGAYYRLGSQLATSMRVATGCHLPAVPDAR